MKKYKMHHGDFTVEYGGMVGLCIMPDRFFPPGDEVTPFLSSGWWFIGNLGFGVVSCPEPS